MIFHRPNKKSKDGVVADVEKEAGSLPIVESGIRNMGQKKHRRDLISRAPHDLTMNLNEDTILSTIRDHLIFTWHGITLERLDTYNDCTPYGITETKAHEFACKEVHRLIEAATNDEAFLFDSNHQFSAPVDIAFAELADIADQIKCAMGIVRLDNARISIQHCTNEVEDTIHNFRHARSRLMGRFNNEHSSALGSGPKRLTPISRNTFLFHTLVDYMTATVARTIVRTAVSEYWSRHTISCLATCATKIKILSYGLERNADISIAAADHALEEMKEYNDSKAALLLRIRVNPNDAVREVDAVATETDGSTRYHEEKTIFNKRIWMILRHALHSLLLSENSKAAADSFQVHSSIYKGGLDGKPTSLSIGRIGEVDAAADSEGVKTAFTALSLLVQNSEKIESSRSTSETSIQSTMLQTDDTVIECDWKNAGGDSKAWKNTLTTKNMDDVVSIIVPMSLGDRPVCLSFLSMLSFASSATDEEDPILQFKHPPLNLQASVTVATGKWRVKEKTMQKWKDDDIIMLTDKKMSFGVRAGADGIPNSLDSVYKSPDLEPLRRAAQTVKDYERVHSDMKKWVIAEDSITIDCQLYAWIVMITASMIICAGIAIPFVVRDRIRGVDPFQITIFTWMVAGFIIVLAKGRYVSEWPWHEFLHGKVICCSIKEVCDVTRIEEQTILMFLLLNERKIILRTRGPFNGMFKQPAKEGEGGNFSINRPVHISTMMASGFIVLKTLSVFNEDIVCLDARQGGENIRPRSSAERLCWLTPEDLEHRELEEGQLSLHSSPRRVDAKPGDETVKRIFRRKLRVDRILGMYVGDSFFG